MQSSAPIDIGSLIVSDPLFRNGRPCIAETGMSVHAIAVRYRAGEDAETIAAHLFDIPLSHVHAAIAYYLVNRARVDAELDEEAALYDELAARSRVERTSH